MSKIYVSTRANRGLTSYLAACGHEVILQQPLPGLDPATAGHPDLLHCSLNPTAGGPVFHGDPAHLGRKYPADVPYNACCTGRYFIHNLKFTAPELLSLAKSTGMVLISVPQGYSRCTCLPVTKNAIITADRGIIEPCRNAGLEVLEVTPGFVELPGYPYGFIGGCAGRIGNAVVFHGSLSGHPDGDRIRRFIEGHGLNVTDFPEFPLTDIGSIIEEYDL